MPPSPLRVWTVLLLGAVGIAWAAIFVRLALPAPPLISAFYRLFLGNLLIAAWLATRSRGDQPWAVPRRAILIALGAGVLFGLDMAFWHTSLVETSVANATLLVNTTPIYVGLWAVVALRETPRRAFVAGAALSLVGTAVLLGAKIGGVRGEALALVAGLFYAAYLLAMKEARGQLTAPVAVCAGGASAALVLAVAAWLHGDAFTGYPAHSWAFLVCAAVVSQVCGVLGIAWALRYLEATYASVALLAQPLGTALFGWWVLGEALTPIQALGGVAVLMGIAVVSVDANRERAHSNSGSSHQG